MTAALERRIEAVMRERTGRECLYVTSARLGLYLAFATWASRGQVLLMSPLEDDTVLFVALAAGLRPVMAPVATADGNIDPSEVSTEVWERVDVVLANHLYGLPDDLPELHARCRDHGARLIEDVAHAIGSEIDGRPVGTFGDAAVFSLSKHVGGVGGIVAFADGAWRERLVRLRDRYVRPPTHPTRVLADARRRAVQLLDGAGAGSALRRGRRAAGLQERTSHRMPLDPERLLPRIQAAADLPAFDAWIRMDLRTWRTRGTGQQLAATLEHLENLAPSLSARVEGVRRLCELPAVAPAVAREPALPLLRVPLLVQDRDAAAAALEAAGLPFHYVYDPPLDDYAGPALVEASRSPALARWWAAHALPVDPMHADRALQVLRELDAARPARPPHTPVAHGAAGP